MTVKGSAGQPASKRAVSIVHTRTRLGDPLADRSSVTITLSGMRTRDDTDPTTAIDLALEREDILELPNPTGGRRCLTINDRQRIAAVLARYRKHDAPAEWCDHLVDLLECRND